MWYDIIWKVYSWKLEKKVEIPPWQNVSQNVVKALKWLAIAISRGQVAISDSFDFKKRKNFKKWPERHPKIGRVLMNTTAVEWKQ